MFDVMLEAIWIVRSFFDDKKLFDEKLFKTHIYEKLYNMVPDSDRTKVSRRHEILTRFSDCTSRIKCDHTYTDATIHAAVTSLPPSLSVVTSPPSVVTSPSSVVTSPLSVVTSPPPSPPPSHSVVTSPSPSPQPSPSVATSHLVTSPVSVVTLSSVTSPASVVS
jgi:hypothetical protein